VIPIHNAAGELIAYAGRSIDGQEPKYRFPAGFRKSLVLFNLHRAIAPKASTVVVVDYAGIRKNSLAVDGSPEVKEAIRVGFRRLKALYADAVFPDVYFVIGRLNSAGTTSSDGLLIGVEMNGRDESTPVDELTSWERAVTGRIADLPHIVAHELVHIQQSNAGGEGRTLLLFSLREGAADFIAELTSGAHTNRAQHAYGNAHEHELWKEFRKDMQGSDLSHWLFQGDRATDRPADLGYYIGYKICEAFYRHASDKSEAVRQIIRITDADAFLQESGYAGGPQKVAQF
jgi:hypothetical protein